MASRPTSVFAPALALLAIVHLRSKYHRSKLQQKRDLANESILDHALITTAVTASYGDVSDHANQEIVQTSMVEPEVVDKEISEKDEVEKGKVDGSNGASKKELPDLDKMLELVDETRKSLEKTDFKDAFKLIRGALGHKEEDTDDFDESAITASFASKPVLTPGPELLISRETDTSRSVTVDELGPAKVVRFLDCKNCTFTLPKDLIALTKVFVEGCSDMRLTIECKLLTRHVEIEGCENIEVNLKTPTDTLQVDLSKDVRIFCDKDSCQKVYHAGVQQMVVCAEDSQTCVTHDYLFPDDPIVVSGKSSKEHQFLTEINGTNLSTKRVEYKEGGLIPERTDDKCVIKKAD